MQGRHAALKRMRCITNRCNTCTIFISLFSGVAMRLQHTVHDISSQYPSNSKSYLKLWSNSYLLSDACHSGWSDTWLFKARLTRVSVQRHENDLTIYCGAYRIRVPTPNAATRGLQHRSVAVGPQTVRMLLGGLIHLRSSQPEWLLEVAPQLRSRQVLAPAYLSRALYPPGFIICNVGPMHA